jgi:hypothetical protein
MEAPPTDDSHDIFLVNERLALGSPNCHDKIHAANCFTESSWKMKSIGTVNFDTSNVNTRSGLFIFGLLNVLLPRLRRQM